MADGIEGALTRKLGPLPVWAYLGVGGGAIILFYLYKRGNSSSATSGTQAAGAPGTSPMAPSPIVITPSSMPNPPIPGPAGPAGPAGPPANTAFPDFETWVSGAYTGQRPDLLSAIQQGRWADLTGQYAKEAAQVAAQSSGKGGGGSVALFGDGAHANPGAVLGPHLLTQHVNITGMGAGGGGRNSRGVTGRTGGSHSGPLHQISQRTGAPMLRLLSLNPGVWRPGSGQSGRYARVQ